VRKEKKALEKESVSVILLAMLITSALTFAYHIQPVRARTITVPDDYSTIQEAINAATSGGTVYVKSGKYYENVIVNKAVSLVGQSRKTATIYGKSMASVIYVDADGVTVTGFTIESRMEAAYDGIWLAARADCNIIGNNVANNWFGIAGGMCSNICISGNTVTNNQHGIAIDMSSNVEIAGNTLSSNLGCGIVCDVPGDNNSILGNTITKNHHGIRFWDSLETEATGHRITGNNIAENHYGIYFDSQYDIARNIITGNNITNNGDGIVLYESSSNYIYHNNFAGNTLQVHTQNSVNVWDDGYPSGGNYWSSYACVDIYNGPQQNLPGSDGVSDVSYIIGVDNQDSYPLMNSFGNPPQPTYELTIGATSGGTTDPAAGTYTYSEGQNVTVHAVPNAWCVLDRWELDGVNIGASNPVNITMNSSHNLFPVFTYAVTIGAHCNTEGKDVTVDIVMDGSPSGYTTPQTLTSLTGTHTFAVPNTDPSNHAFRQWSTGETSTTVIINTGGTYVAYYHAKYTLTITASTGGITSPPRGNHGYWDGTTLSVTALSYTNYVLDHWELDGSSVGSQNPISITMDRNHTLHAVFTYIVTIKAHCSSQCDDVSVDVMMDGSPSSYMTPHVFTGLTGTHTFTVPDKDSNGHPFKRWNTGETNTTISVSSGGICTAIYGADDIHDVALVDIKPSKTVVGQGCCIPINVTVENLGDYLETFNITVYANTTVIARESAQVQLASTITVTWNSTGFVKGNYTISGVVATVSGETCTADNTLVKGWVIVAMLGDLTGETSGVPDRKCDMRDVGLVARHFGQTVTSAQPNCDMTGPVKGVPDDKVDMREVGLVARHFGETDP
jgi:parallel beta-helix repeat protein